MTISVVVPVLNEASGIAARLRALRSDGFTEIVVADGGSEDRTAELAAAEGATVVQAPRGRARQMNAGAAAARGEVLLFLHADTQLPKSAYWLITDALEDPGVVGGCFRLAFDARHPVLDVSAWASRFETAFTTFGDQGYFVRREAFEAVGGFPELPLMEDVAFRRLVRKRGRFMKLPVAATTSARRFLRKGPLRQQLLNGLLVAAYLAGVSPERLKKHYR